jgi:iron complex outermembrane receptor protein
VRRDVGRIFGNVEWKPVRWFTGNVGLAGESDSLAGAHVSPRISSNFHFNSQNTVRLGVSRAYRTGSIQNYRGHEETPIPNAGPYRPYYEFIYRGTPDMAAERLDTLEVGYLGDWRDWRSSLDVRVFDERVANRRTGWFEPAIKVEIDGADSGCRLLVWSTSSNGNLLTRQGWS